MDIAAIGLGIVWATEKITELIKPMFGALKDRVPWPVVSAIIGGLLAWAFNVILVSALMPWVNYLLVAVA